MSRPRSSVGKPALDAGKAINAQSAATIAALRISSSRRTIRDILYAGSGEMLPGSRGISGRGLSLSGSTGVAAAAGNGGAPFVRQVVEDRLHFLSVDRLLVEQRVDHALDLRPVRLEDVACVGVARVDDLAHFAVDLLAISSEVVAVFAEVAAEEELCCPRPYWIGPRSLLMPNWVTIRRAIWVARSKSFDAPLVTSLNCSSSAIRPPSAAVIWAIISALVIE